MGFAYVGLLFGFVAIMVGLYVLSGSWFGVALVC